MLFRAPSESRDSVPPRTWIVALLGYSQVLGIPRLESTRAETPPSRSGTRIDPALHRHLPVAQVLRRR